MPFETFASPSRRIAVIGGGIAGLSAAHFLAADNAVVLFESESRLGGHARTVIAGRRGDEPVTKSNMSFGASIGGGRLEYALASLDSMFAQRRNLLSPAFLRM